MKPIPDTLYIDDEFKRLLPSHRPEELEQLKANIEADGEFRDAIVIWKGHETIIDGHTRWEIWCQLPPDTHVKPPVLRQLAFETREDVMSWIARKQLGQRNLTPENFTYFVGKLYQSLKKSHGGDRKSAEKTEETAEKSSGQNVHLKRTAETVAKATGTNEKTVRRADKFATALDSIAEVNPKAADDIRNGSLHVSKADVVKIAALSSDAIGTALKNVRQGLAWSGNPKSNGKAKPATAAAPNTDGESVVLDSLDRPVPERFRNAHGAAAAIQSEARKLDAILRELVALRSLPGGEFLELSSLQVAFKDLKGKIRGACYWSECPKCKGKGGKCRDCNCSGWWPDRKKGHLSAEDKDWLGI